MIIVVGGVDPANQAGWATHSQEQYTIARLSRDQRDLYGRMMDEGDLPEKLRRLPLKQ